MLNRTRSEIGRPCAAESRDSAVHSLGVRRIENTTVRTSEFADSASTRWTVRRFTRWRPLRMESWLLSSAVPRNK
jgi:hypothetical protein